MILMYFLSLLILLDFQPLIFFLFFFCVLGFFFLQNYVFGEIDQVSKWRQYEGNITSHFVQKTIAE